jgi:hypothetical protein
MSTHHDTSVIRESAIHDPVARYGPEPRRDWVRAAITLSLIFALCWN